VLLFVASGYGAPDIDRSAVDWKTPAEIKWVRNAAGTNEQAVLRVSLLRGALLAARIG
jgi:hypothetical protein